MSSSSVWNNRREWSLPLCRDRLIFLSQGQMSSWPSNPNKAKNAPSSSYSKPLKKHQNHIKVAVRVRPVSSFSSKKEKCHRCVEVDERRNELTLGDKVFQFDHVLGECSSQESVYQKCVRSVIRECCQGVNVSLFCYGQTGSGKTHTLVGNEGREDEMGVIGHVNKQIRDEIEAKMKQQQQQQQGSVVSCSLRVSFVELYNDQIIDLFNEGPEEPIHLREDAEGHIHLVGVRHLTIGGMKDFMTIFHRGCVARKTAATKMNETSSRGHAILTIFIDKTIQRMRDNATQILSSKVQLVDLSGNERQKRTCSVGLRFKESIAINSELLVLSRILTQLSQGGRAASCQQLGYREAKLTRILKDSLGGNAKSLMIACVSPFHVDASASLCTLKYASSARKIMNKISTNVRLLTEAKPMSVSQYHGDEIEDLREIIEAREKQLEKLQRMLQHKNDDLCRDETIFAEQEVRIQKLQHELIEAKAASQQGIVEEEGEDEDVCVTRFWKRWDLLMAKPEVERQLSHVQRNKKLAEEERERWVAKEKEPQHEDDHVGDIPAALEEEIVQLDAENNKLISIMDGRSSPIVFQEVVESISSFTVSKTILKELLQRSVRQTKENIELKKDLGLTRARCAELRDSLRYCQLRIKKQNKENNDKVNFLLNQLRHQQKDQPAPKELLKSFYVRRVPVRALAPINPPEITNNMNENW